MAMPPSHDSGIKKKVATPAAQKNDYREAFKVVTTRKKRKKEEMFRVLPAATALMSHVVPNKNQEAWLSRVSSVTVRGQTLETSECCSFKN